jgi:hypothetical protein
MRPARSHLILFLLPLSIACKGKGSGTDDTSDTGGQDAFSRFVNVTEAVGGDHTSCYAPTAAGGDWTVQDVDSSKVALLPATGPVEDFQEGDGVEDVTLEVWYGDRVSGAADQSTVSDGSGQVSLTLPSCQPYTYKSSMDPSMEQVKDTFESHQIDEHPDDGTVESWFNSVSSTTYQLIPGLLGVSIDADKSVIAGTAFDCSETAASNVQVVVVDAEGGIPESLVVKYFVEEWPNRDQPATSADGLWVAMNVPPGSWEVQAWGVVDGTLSLLGATALDTFVDSINISNIYTGLGDGVKYPANCLLP